MTNHPITPPPELVQQWYRESDNQFSPYYVYIATQAARWGSDQELEACVEWIYQHFQCGLEWSKNLRAARRPKLPTLKEQALTALHAIATGANNTREQHQDLETLRTALELLPND